MTGLAWLGVAACGLVLGVIAVSAIGARKWAGSTASLLGALEAARTDAAPIDAGARPQAPRSYDSRELEGLPLPVQRYFRAVLKDGQPFIAAVTIAQAGTFNLSATAEQWRPFTATQRVVTKRPGFLWDARMSMLPGLAVRVVDSYIAGSGLLHAAMLGLFSVADASGDGEIARGEFMRFAAEAPWYPTALLPSQGVQWQAVDEHSANATFVDGPLRLTLLFISTMRASSIRCVRKPAAPASAARWSCCRGNAACRTTRSAAA
jgi:hypothetical protein